VRITKINLAPPKTESRRWASLALGAEYIGVSEKTIRRMIASGQITGYRVGPRLIRIDLNEVDVLARPVPTMTASA